jgi:hypothetical protein
MNIRAGGRTINASISGLATAVALCALLADWGLGNEPGATTTVERLVTAAKRAEIEGDIAGHFALLRQAVRIDPNYQLARWQLGQVQIAGDWIAVEEAQRRAAADPLQGDYRRLRTEHGDTAQGQLALARWCRSNGLEDEARVHWTSVLSVDPNNSEALRRLRLHWYDGELRTREEIKEAKQESIGTRRAARQWAAAVAGWQRALSKKDDGAASEALAEIRAVNELAAIPSLERVTLATEGSEAKSNKVRRKLSLAFLEALDAMSDPVATESLVRHGVQSSFSDVRDGAIERLRKRPLDDFVPTLLDGLTSRIESSVQVVRDDDGSVQYLHSMYREGPFADWSHRSSHSIRWQGDPARIAARLASDNSQLAELTARNTRTDTVTAAGAERTARRFEQQVVAAEEQIEQANAAAEAGNARIIAVLAGTTDRSLGPAPRAWWDWWQDHTEYYRAEKRPVYETQDVSQAYITPDIPKECFARGTPVWTKTGQRAIETLELGELVLAQNVDTGELAYKPVIGRTVRPPSELLKVTMNGETIRTTRGHLFWVAGRGWRMAKELAVGAPLHGVTGSMRTNAIEPDGQDEAYNLVVAEFNSYFVGESGVLVHDNTPRTPTRATVPGLAAK